MSRLPGPGGQWEESTEGDLDPDLAEESNSGLEDWERPFEPRRTMVIAMRVVAALVLLAIVVSAVAALR